MQSQDEGCKNKKKKDYNLTHKEQRCKHKLKETQQKWQVQEKNEEEHAKN